MLRKCDGTDPNLLRLIPAGEESADGTPVYVPCDCGKLFDDVHYTVIHPHMRIGGSLMITVKAVARMPRRSGRGGIAFCPC